ncbi:hypothetical protein [Cellulomonas xiejunii]|uniref:Major facilitator superfamily (MFS) profile domain-containing protein n=1 Tax=Cellulomonas xiejunii TaxID=2968083 RepID=A0ABY5KR53_9CELL|nr:hypothetical protein [Cellulomonas xiejunii]MCC2315195.1 hypothetical protein [Cellulomonas xiejunii]MCC2321662.1 hypothetical protein [Cellulomonas xiejunii]UUI72976.1 hypothetical protein NP048_05910 [Cellulomonas xiejunii]
MSIPTSGRPQDEPTRRYEAVPPAAAAPRPTSAAPASGPPAVSPAAPAAGPAAPAGARTESRLTVETGRFWAGVAATALVAALVGVVGVIVLDQILRIDLVFRDPFGVGSPMGAYVLGGILVAVAAGALLQLLVLTTPRPRAFFGWILGLATVVATLLPLTWTDAIGSAIASGIVNLFIGIAVWSLLTGVLGWTVRRVAV